MTSPRWIISDPVFEADEFIPKLPVYPWAGHRNFAYDLTRFLRPRRIVELGTHWGTSFFAFCQAVKDQRLDTHCVAVDTWKGDEHTGAYGDDVFEAVQRVVTERFGTVNVTLLRMRFTDALERVDDESIDILHIDGCHYYEAVSADYSAWLCKLRPQGVVLFHDVAASSGYGSSRFWQELSANLPSFEFAHSWGLGILFPKGDALHAALCDNIFADKLKTYEYKAEFTLASIKVADLSRMIEDRDGLIQEQDRLVQQRDQTTAAQQEMIEQRDALISTQDDLVRERDDAITAQRKLIEARDQALREQTRLVEEKDTLLRRQETILDERAQAMTDQARLIDEKDAALKQQEELIRARDEALAAQTRLIEERDAALHRQEEMIQARDASITDQTRMIDERDANLRQLGEQVTEREHTIAERDAALEQKEAALRAETEARQAAQTALDDLETRLRKPGFFMKALGGAILRLLRLRR